MIPAVPRARRQIKATEKVMQRQPCSSVAVATCKQSEEKKAQGTSVVKTNFRNERNFFFYVAFVAFSSQGFCEKVAQIVVAVTV